jgi:uncharacterized phage protein (TIGR01671 family)
MREFKFRAWSFTSKKMIDRVLAGPGDPCSIVYDEERKDWVNFDEACGVIMQFTGLKDRHGKEIYEGDILSWQGWRGEVFWDTGFAAWRARHIGSLGGIPDLEIIGNIYENPELVNPKR